mmetsp:Transcript_26531/g.41059  ORF Transcript_26531/g.41059 Transcript_26531/m.41059 type:complete len:161 (-) Transcript_26531:174-656(-)
MVSAHPLYPCSWGRRGVLLNLAAHPVAYARLIHLILRCDLFGISGLAAVHREFSRGFMGGLVNTVFFENVVEAYVRMSAEMAGRQRRRRRRTGGSTAKDVEGWRGVLPCAAPAVEPPPHGGRGRTMDGTAALTILPPPTSMVNVHTQVRAPLSLSCRSSL